MSPVCVNEGGVGSLIRLPATPTLEQEISLADDATGALAAWQGRSGEILTAVDPQNLHYRVRITSTDPDTMRAIPYARLDQATESPLRIDVLHALPSKERFELVLEKLTELGVFRVVPMETERSSTLSERDASQRKSHRWPHLLRRASRQCRRAMLPELYAPVDFAAALTLATEAEVKLLLDET